MYNTRSPDCVCVMSAMCVCACVCVCVCVCVCAVVCVCVACFAQLNHLSPPPPLTHTHPRFWQALAAASPVTAHLLLCKMQCGCYPADTMLGGRFVLDDTRLGASCTHSCMQTLMMGSTGHGQGHVLLVQGLERTCRRRKVAEPRHVGMSLLPPAPLRLSRQGSTPQRVPCTVVCTGCVALVGAHPPPLACMGPA